MITGILLVVATFVLSICIGTAMRHWLRPRKKPMKITTTKEHEFSRKNKSLIENSENVGCFYCLQIFPKDEVIRFVNEESTALCPRCGIDSLLPDAAVNIMHDLLLLMSCEWFTPYKEES